jgi:hypothetical protein
MSGERTYLAGPMRGIAEFNFPAFFNGEAQLRRKGYYVHNPAREDDEAGFLWADTTGNEDMSTLWTLNQGKSLRGVLAEDINWILQHADYVAVLPGWEKSSGARAEVSTALAVGIPVARVEDFEPDWISAAPLRRIYEVPPLPKIRFLDGCDIDEGGTEAEDVADDEARLLKALGPVWANQGRPASEVPPQLCPLDDVAREFGVDLDDDEETEEDRISSEEARSRLLKAIQTIRGYPRAGEEVRMTSATGGSKGSKRARFDLIPTGALIALAEHYGKGAEKYHPVNGRDNWRNGYDWGLSYAAMQRHANAFWSGEDYDPETGSNHLTAVAWHAFTLFTFFNDSSLPSSFDTRQDNWRGSRGEDAA